jgi:hypothetical protein
VYVLLFGILIIIVGREKLIKANQILIYILIASLKTKTYILIMSMNQVRKKLSDIITDLHQLVAPIGKVISHSIIIIILHN